MPGERARVARGLLLWAHMHARAVWGEDGLALELMSETGGCTPPEVAEALAGLVDPTCSLVSTVGDGEPGGAPVWRHALSCGHEAVSTGPEPPGYCPECGSRVTDCPARL